MLNTFFQACLSDFYHGFYYCVLITAFAISLIYYKTAGKAFKWIAILIFLTSISEFIALYVGLTYGSNGIVYDIFTPIEFLIYAIIYNLFLNNRTLKNLFVGMAIAMFVIDVANVIFFQPITEIPTNTMNIEMVLLVFLSLLLFISIRQKPIYENIIAEGVFWFNSAVLFYYSFNILIWGFYGIMYDMIDPPKINRQMLLLSSSLLYLIYASSIILNCTSENKMRLKNA